MNAKEKSRAYFNAHRKSLLARGGYWRADYRHVMTEIERFRPASLIDIGCGPGGFLCAVQKRFPDIQLYALDLSEEMVRETQERLGPSAVAIVGDSEHMPLESEQYEVVTCNMSIKTRRNPTAQRYGLRIPHPCPGKLGLSPPAGRRCENVYPQGNHTDDSGGGF